MGRKVTKSEKERLLAKVFSCSPKSGATDCFHLCYMYGGMYHIFNGTEVDNIAVGFINEATGEIINTANSRDMEE